MKTTTNTDNRKAQAARENGRKSKGPITAAGKAKSRFNALRHGYTSHRAVLLSTESEEELQQFSQAYFDRLQPADTLETLKVEEIIAAEWRLRRLWNAETTFIDSEIANVQTFSCSIQPVDDNLHTALALQSLTAFPTSTALAESIARNAAASDQLTTEYHSPGGQLLLLQRYARSLSYQASRAFQQFRLLQAERLRQQAESLTPFEPLDQTHPNHDHHNDDNNDNRGGGGTGSSSAAPDQTHSSPTETTEPNQPNHPQNHPQPTYPQSLTPNPDTPRAIRRRYLRHAPKDDFRCATM